MKQYIFFESKTITIFFISCVFIINQSLQWEKEQEGITIEDSSISLAKTLKITLVLLHDLDTDRKDIISFISSRRLLFILYDDDNVNSFYFILQLQLGEMDNINVTLMEFLKWRMEID